MQVFDFYDILHQTMISVYAKQRNTEMISVLLFLPGSKRCHPFVS
jgi:hypothetical protein